MPSKVVNRFRFALPNSPDSQVYDRLVKLFVIGHPDFRAWLTERVKAVADVPATTPAHQDFSPRRPAVAQAATAAERP